MAGLDVAPIGMKPDTDSSWEPPKGRVTIPEEDLLAEAYSLTTGPRNQDYGKPTDDFHTIATIWTALMRHKLKEGEVFRPNEVAKLMVGVKLSRMTKSAGKRDNWTDIAGYARCGWLCVEENGA